MKFFISVILVFCFAFNSSGQERLIIKFKVTHLLDTTNENSIHRYDAFLAVSPNFSYYSSANQLKNDSYIPATKNIESGNKNYSFSYNQSGYKAIPFYETNKIIYTQEEKKLLETFSLANQHFVVSDDEKLDFSWKIARDTTTILGHLCQKAQGQFKGRKWIVWFTKDIDYKVGPWKLRGLPGIILKANDLKEQISFIAYDISTKEFPVEKLKTRYKEYISINRKKLYTSYKAYAADPLAYISATNGLNFSTADLEATFSGFTKRKPNELKLANNPFQFDF